MHIYIKNLQFVSQSPPLAIMTTTTTKYTTISFLLFPLVNLLQLASSASLPATSNGYSCSTNRSIYPCQAYAFYRAGAKSSLLDLPSIGDLFGVSRLMIARASSLSVNSTLTINQPLLIPLTCSCHSNITYHPATYRIATGDSFSRVSYHKFGNLTTYQAVELVNPKLIPTRLYVDTDVIFPIFCQCPTKNAPAIVTYSFQPGDNFSSVAAQFGSDIESLVSLNGREESVKPFTTVLIPVTKLPPPVILASSRTPPEPLSILTGKDENKGSVVGLSVGLGIMGFLCVVLLVLFLRLIGRRRREAGFGRRRKHKKGVSDHDDKLTADILEWLDKYKVYRIEELKEATGDFGDSSLIQGSVYKGTMDGKVYAIKKMKWNCSDELKILQMVNHTNLVKLQGFSIDPDTGTCHLIYDYIENGSLHSWLHDSNRVDKLDWHTRLLIALDLANGLQYIHEHTWPRVVHKDIKSSNVLLDANMHAKIANFGLARSGCNAVTTHIVGTQGYIAPEYLTDGLVTPKLDVFAYGALLLELVSGREAVGEEGGVLWMEVEGIDLEKIGEWMDKALARENSVATMLEGVTHVMNIARACLQKDPGQRPSMVDVAYTLSKAVDLDSDFSGDGVEVGGGDLQAR